MWVFDMSLMAILGAVPQCGIWPMFLKSAVGLVIDRFLPWPEKHIICRTPLPLKIRPHDRDKSIHGSFGWWQLQSYHSMSLSLNTTAPTLCILGLKTLKAIAPLTWILTLQGSDLVYWSRVWGTVNSTRKGILWSLGHIRLAISFYSYTDHIM